MLREYIIRGCVCHLSEETIAAYEEEQREIEESRRVREELNRAYRIACGTNDPIDWSFYSDLHKECYGVRPHY